MDIQQIIAVGFFWLIAGVMMYAFLHIEKVAKLIVAVYRFVGIKIEFDDLGKMVIRMVAVFLAALFIFGSIAVIIE